MAVSGEATIRNAYGFHVRPSTLFLKEVKRFNCKVVVSAGEMTAEATSPMALLALGAVKGDTVSIACDGEDEEVALATLVELVESSFGGIE